ncbi:hypothetical protein BLOT_001405 [Blomia tropicalis]|nr:hypothetical protein BLOT_001405 [Blomia tropicalis]
MSHHYIKDGKKFPDYNDERTTTTATENNGNPFPINSRSEYERLWPCSTNNIMDHSDKFNRFNVNYFPKYSLNNMEERFGSQLPLPYDVHSLKRNSLATTSSQMPSTRSSRISLYSTSDSSSFMYIPNPSKMVTDSLIETQTINHHQRPAPLPPLLSYVKKEHLTSFKGERLLPPIPLNSINSSLYSNSSTYNYPLDQCSDWSNINRQQFTRHWLKSVESLNIEDQIALRNLNQPPQNVVEMNRQLKYSSIDGNNENHSTPIHLKSHDTFIVKRLDKKEDQVYENVDFESSYGFNRSFNLPNSLDESSTKKSNQSGTLDSSKSKNEQHKDEKKNNSHSGFINRSYSNSLKQGEYDCYRNTKERFIRLDTEQFFANEPPSTPLVFDKKEPEMKKLCIEFQFQWMLIAIIIGLFLFIIFNQFSINGGSIHRVLSSIIVFLKQIFYHSTPITTDMNSISPNQTTILS